MQVGGVKSRALGLGEQLFQGTIGECRFGQILTAEERPPHEHLRKGRPAAPLLDRQAPLPLRKVAAVFQIGERDARIGQDLADVLDVRILRHPNHHHVVMRDGLAHLGDGRGMKVTDVTKRARQDSIRGKQVTMANRGRFLVEGERSS